MRRLFALLSLLVLATSCSDSITSTENSLSGTYILKTVNGAALPFVLSQQGTSKAELLADSFTFKSDGTFTRFTSSRTTVNGVVTTDSHAADGTWARHDTDFAILESSAGSTRITGQLTTDGFTFTDVGFKAVYGR